MTNEEILRVFGDFDPSEYEDEAQERWGDTAAYRESAGRTARYSAADWEELGREAGEINDALIALMEAGTPPDSDAAMDAAERHRAHISRWLPTKRRLPTKKRQTMMISMVVRTVCSRY